MKGAEFPFDVDDTKNLHEPNVCFGLFGARLQARLHGVGTFQTHQLTPVLAYLRPATLLLHQENKFRVGGQMSYLSLDRCFVERNEYNPDELIAAEIRGKLIGWDRVLLNRCSVVVAPANFGKTTEMQQQARQLRADGHTAVFVALRRLAERQTLDRALTDDERDAFRAWKASPVNTLTVFVDSLDEAAAVKRENIEYLVRDVADELGWPNEHVKWVISTRPAVLTSDIFQQLTGLLTKSSAKTRSEISTDLGRSTEAIVSVTDAKLHLFSMVPLEDHQAISYLTGKHLGLNATKLIALAKERGLAGFARSPGGLDILALIDIVTNPPDSLTAVFERVVSAIERKLGEDPRLIDAGRPAQSDLIAAAQRLAAASQVCQLVNFQISASSLAIPINAISARLITSSLLDEAATRQLLGSQLFIDAGFHQVKVYPDELLPYLAAKRLSGLVHSLDQAERMLDNFIWVAPSGEQGVQRNYLPMMGWLATLNAHCREVILKKDPQALAFFGDLRSSAVPLAAAQEALSKSIERIAKHGDRLGRGVYFLTSENYWQAGPERMVSTISTLYEKYKDDYSCREALTNIAATCKLDVLRDKVLRRHGSSYENLLSDHNAVAYLIALGRPSDLKAIAVAALSSRALNENIVDLLLRKLGWSQFSSREVTTLLDNQFVAGPRGFYLAYSLGAGGFMASATDEQLYQLARGLIVRLAKLQTASAGRGVHNKQQYVGLVATVLEALVSRTIKPRASIVARLLFVFHRVIDEEWLHSSDTRDLTEAISKNTFLRQALLMLIMRGNLNDDDLLMSVIRLNRLVDYSAEDIKIINHPQLSKVVEDWHVRCAAAAQAQSKIQPKVQKVHENTPNIDNKTKRYLKSVLPTLRDGTATGALEWIAGWLLQTNPSSRYGEVNFNTFEKIVGMEIAEATRQGMSCIWRKTGPRFDEDKPNSTYHIAAAGLQALHLELGDGSQLPYLSEKEVRHALRYGLIEINGYPKWFWPLVEAHCQVAISELVAIVEEAPNGAVSKYRAEELLASLPEAPHIVWNVLGSLAWKYLVATKPIQSNVVSSLLKSSLLSLGNIPQKNFERIAMQKMTGSFRSPLPVKVDSILQNQRSEALVWAAHWLRSRPLKFRNAVYSWGPKDGLAVKAFLFDLAANLGREDEGISTRIAKASDEGVIALEDLFLWMRWAVDPVDDPKHPDGISYSLGVKDYAANFRNSIIGGIAQADSQEAYDALNRIQLQLPKGDRYFDYLRRSQFELRERQCFKEPLPQIEYDQFEREFCGNVTGFSSFAMAVHADLRSVKYDIEQGEHSLRSFFSKVDFQRINQSGATGKKAGLALEVNFQQLLASELNHYARGRYSVTMESHTAESKRRDVLCSNNGWRASIELKMSERWTLEDYVVALEEQLVGQYMRDHNSAVGFLVIVLQRNNRRWKDPITGKRLTFDEVIALLVTKAQSLEAKDRSRYIRVIAINATEPQNFREVFNPKAIAQKRKSISFIRKSVNSKKLP